MSRTDSICAGQWGIPFGRAGKIQDYAQAVLNFAVNGYVSPNCSILFMRVSHILNMIRVR